MPRATAASLFWGPTTSGMSVRVMPPDRQRISMEFMLPSWQQSMILPVSVSPVDVVHLVSGDVGYDAHCFPQVSWRFPASVRRWVFSWIVAKKNPAGSGLPGLVIWISTGGSGGGLSERG